MPEAPNILGIHWIADAHGCDPNRLTLDEIRRALEELPGRLRLTAVSPPAVTRQSDGSVSGIVLIAESHFSLHGYPSCGVLHTDIFSCAQFDPGLAKVEVTQRFGAHRFEETLLQRRYGGQ